METLYKFVEMLLNSSALMTFIGGAIIVYFLKWTAKDDKSEWRSFAGRLVDLIKEIERENPEMSGQNKLAMVVIRFADLYKKVAGKELTEYEVAEIESEISIVHAELESLDQLRNDGTEKKKKENA